MGNILGAINREARGERGERGVMEATEILEALKSIRDSVMWIVPADGRDFTYKYEAIDSIEKLASAIENEPSRITDHDFIDGGIRSGDGIWGVGRIRVVVSGGGLEEGELGE